jgi:aminopeptidase YwaD
LAINMDDVGYRDGRIAYSFYECSKRLRAACEKTLARYPGLLPGDPWVQGNHSMFVQQGVPAVAFISENSEYLMRKIIHTRRDRVELVDSAKLAELASAVVECALQS